jgi:AraC-like DNA-binding protein
MNRDVRFETARTLLETSANGIKHIAADVGYQDETSFRRAFRRHSGMTPSGEAVRMVNALPLDAPLVTWGRIIGPIWLRLSRDQSELRALLSEDGLTWMKAGETSVTKKSLLAGCFACSGLGSISAQVTFEQVTLKSLQ